MAAVETLLRWIRGRKHRSKRARAPLSNVMNGAEVTTETQLLELQACQCRASMKLPPIPREDRRLRSTITKERFTESPAHIYEEIPYGRYGEYPPGGRTTGNGFPDTDEEYLTPSDESSKNLRRFLLGTVKCSALSSKVVLKDTCEYSNVSPLSALGLETASFKRCTKCKRPHGVYNSTVYQHDDTNGSPDLISFEWHHSSPALDGCPHHPGANGPSGATRYYSICDLRENARATTQSRDGNSVNGGKSSASRTSGASQKRGRIGAGRRDQGPSLQTMSSAFRVVNRANRTIHGSLRRQRRAKTEGAKEEYEYYLSKVKHNLKLEKDVYQMSKSKPKPSEEKSSGSEYEPIGAQNEVANSTSVDDAHVQTMRSVTKSFHKHVTALKSRKCQPPPCLRPSKSDTRRHSLPGSIVAMTTPSLSTDYEDYEEYEIPVSSNHDSDEEYDALSKYTDVDLSEKLSCRATNYTKGSTASSCYGSLSTASLDTYYSSSMYGYHWSSSREKHNPLLSDIMRRNHDRQNLLI